MWRTLAAAILVVGSSLGLAGPGLATAPAAPSWASPNLADVRTRLDGLSWDEFIESSYRLYLLRFPEAVTRMGMAADLDVRNDRLNDYSDAYVHETMDIESEILVRLRSYDRSALAPAEQRIYDACEWYWDDLVRAHPFVYCDYPVSHLFVTSVDQLTQELLLEIQPLVTVADAEDYVLRLEQMGRQFDGVIDGLGRRAAAGVVLPLSSLDWALPGVQQIASGPAASCPYLTHLQSALAGIVDLTEDEHSELDRRAAAAVQQSVIPGYQRLASELSRLRRAAPEIGIGRVPDGAAYYEYLIRHFSGVEIPAADIHELGLREVDRLQGEIRAAARDLGYPAETMSMASLFSAIQAGGGYAVGPQILQEYEHWIDRAKVDSLAFLPALPTTDVVVQDDPVGGFYLSAPRDGSRPAVFGAQTTGTQPRFTMRTLAYHETIPGHHVQIALAQAMNLPLVLSENSFLGFTEGWALYAERLAWEAGWYADDPYGNLGRLQFELMRAARLVVDTGIHALGWGASEAIDYYAAATGRSPQLAQSDVYRYAVWPGQAVSYAVGYIEILNQRARAQQALGGAFDLKAFHGALLASGNTPLGLVSGWVDAYIEGAGGNVDAAAGMP